jgi:hypothetical protein
MYKVIWNNIVKEFATINKAREFIKDFPGATIIKGNFDFYKVDFDLIRETI